MTVPVRVACEPGDWALARELVQRYAVSLPVDLSYQQFDDEVRHLDSMYGPPRGLLLLAGDAEPCGCVALRPLAPAVDAAGRTGEVKRLFVLPSQRGRGIGRALLDRLMAEATTLGYERLVLDTLPSMVDARALYHAMGFRPIAPYAASSVPGTSYFERWLRTR